MRLVLQRVTQATITINKSKQDSISQGIVALLGIETNDSSEDIDWIFKKLVNLRIFNNEEGVMNRSLLELEAELLLVSQFTLHASTKKGNRPSYSKAAPPKIAIPIYEECIKKAQELVGDKLKTGEFGADMQIELCNDGPVTIIIDSKNKD